MFEIDTSPDAVRLRANTLFAALPNQFRIVRGGIMALDRTTFMPIDSRVLDVWLKENKILLEGDGVWSKRVTP